MVPLGAPALRLATDRSRAVAWRGRPWSSDAGVSVSEGMDGKS